MKCPKCSKKMLDFPSFDEQRKVLTYWLCLDCMTRIIKKCKWRVIVFTQYPSDEFYWCMKINKLCNTKSEPCGYHRCPQIREWGEQQADWVKGKNLKFEEKERKEKRYQREYQPEFPKDLEREKNAT